MTRTRSYLLTTTALASIVGAAVPAFAQAPAPAQMYAPAPMYAPPPAPAPMVAPAPMQEPMPVMPVAPMMAPRAADDMTGSVGFGVGVIAGANDLVKPDVGNLFMRYFLSDSMSIVPKLTIAMTKQKDQDAAWAVAPEVSALFTLLKGASTRFDAGLGLGLEFGKFMAAPVQIHDMGAPSTTIDKVYVAIYVPVTLGVEHYFTRWFAMGIWASSPVLAFGKQGDPWQFNVNINNTNYLGTLTFFTD